MGGRREVFERINLPADVQLGRAGTPDQAGFAPNAVHFEQVRGFLRWHALPPWIGTDEHRHDGRAHAPEQLGIAEEALARHTFPRRRRVARQRDGGGERGQQHSTLLLQPLAREAKDRRIRPADRLDETLEKGPHPRGLRLRGEGRRVALHLGESC